MITLLASMVAAAAIAPVALSEAEADFRKAITETCSEVLLHGRAFFTDDARLAAAKLTVSPVVRALLDKPGFPVGATGEHVVITLADNVGTRRNGPACTVSATPPEATTALRDRFLATFNPTEKQREDLRRHRHVSVLMRPTDGRQAHLVGFWRLGVYVERTGL